MHLGLAEQKRVASDEFADGIKAIAADDEEIVISILIAAHQTGTVLVRTAQFCHVGFDSYIAEILFRRGPEIETRLLDQDPVAALIVIHDAVDVGDAVPASRVIIKLLLIEDITRVRRRCRKDGNWGGAGGKREKKKQRGKKAGGFHAGILSEL